MDIDVNRITSIVNYALIGVFAFIVVALCYAFIRGLFRGWRYGTYRLGYFLIHILIGIACLTLIVDAIGKFPLSSVLNSHEGSVTYQDTTISFQISTLEETFKDFFVQVIRHFSPATDPTSAVNTAYSLTRSLLMVLTILIEGILLATVFNFFCFLLWHLLFKRFIAKKKRKESYKKGKLIAAFEGFVVALLVSSMILVPCSSLINSVIHGFNESTSGKENETKIIADDSTYQMVKSVADTYNDSIFSKAFFSWNTNQDGYSFDQQLMNWLTSSDYEKVKISFVEELQHASEIGTYAIETGLLSQSASSAHKVWMFLTSEYSPLLIRALAESDLLMGLIPAAFSVVMNIDAIETKIGNEWGIDYSKEDWGSSIDNIADLFSDVQQTGLLGYMSFDQDSDKVVFDKSNEISLFSEDKSKAFENAFSRIKNNNNSWKLFNMLLVSFSVNTVINSPSSDDILSFKDFLPEVSPDYYQFDEKKGRNVPIKGIPDTYASLDLGTEVGYIYRAFSRLNEIDSGFTGSLIDGLLKQQFDTKTFLNLVIDNIDQVISIFTGEDENQKFNYGENGISQDENCLLDSSLVCNAMPKLFRMLGHSLTASIGVEANIDQVNQGVFYDDNSNLLSLDKRIKNEKKEVSSLLAVASTFSKHEAGKKMLKDYESKPGITYNEKDGSLNHIDADLLDALIDTMSKIDDSALLSEVVPDIFEGVLKKNSGTFTSFDLSFDDFDFHPINEKGESILGQELSNLLTMYRDCQDLFEYVKTNSSSLSSSDQSTINHFLGGLRPFLKTEGNCELLTLLNGFGDSKILNPNDNANYLKVMNKIFNSAFGYKYEGETIFTPKKENAAVCKILCSLIDQDLLDTFGNASLSISSFSFVNFEELLSPLDGTTMLQDVFASFLDEKLVKGALNCEIPGVSFHNVTDWSKEGGSLNTMMTFATSIGDFSNIDLMNGDPVALGGIIETLSQNEMFVDASDRYHFGEFFYQTLLNGLEKKESVQTFFSDREPDSNGDLTFAAFKNDTISISMTDWENESSIYENILSSLKIVGGLDAFSESSIVFSTLNVDGFSSLMDDLADSRSIGRVLSYHIYEKIGEALQNGAFELGNGYGRKGKNDKFGNMNLDEIWKSYSHDGYLSSLEKRKREFSYLSSILKIVASPNYGLLDDKGNIQNEINVNKVSTEFLVKPLLVTMSKSVVFNTLPSDANADLFTAFENEMANIAYQSGIYGNDETKKNDTFYNILVHVGSLRLDSEGNVFITPIIGNSKFNSESFDLFIKNYEAEIDTICNAMDESRSIGAQFNEWKSGTYKVDTASPWKSVIASSVLRSLRKSKIYGPAIEPEKGA